MPMTTAEKTRETRLRRMAERQGLALHKSPRRDHRAIDFEMWRIDDRATNTVVAGGEFNGFSLTIDEVEWYLKGER
jgi:hypothetical protein